MNRVVQIAQACLGGKKKKLFIFVYLANNTNSSLSLGSTIKQAKFKHNYVFVNKLVNMRLNLTIYDDIILYFFMYTCLI